MTRFVFRFTHVKHLGHHEFISGSYRMAVKFDYQIISCLPRYAMLERLTVLGAELRNEESIPPWGGTESKLVLSQGEDRGGNKFTMWHEQLKAQHHPAQTCISPFLKVWMVIP